MSYAQVHVSEVPDQPVVECTTASVLELMRAQMNGLPGRPPATAQEREALRAASGASDLHGASLDDLARGCHSRYGQALGILSGFPLDMESAPDGTFWAVQGDMHALPAHYWRWDPGFGSREPAPHCAVAYRASGALLWCDPLAPWSSRWRGEPITAAQVRNYWAHLPGAKVARAVVRPVAVPTRYSLLIPAGAQVEHSAKDSRGRIVLPWQVDVWGSSPSSAPCAAPTTSPTTAGVNATAARVSAGKYAGQWVHMNGQVQVVPR